MAPVLLDDDEPPSGLSDWLARFEELKRSALMRVALLLRPLLACCTILPQKLLRAFAAGSVGAAAAPPHRFMKDARRPPIWSR